MKAAVLCLLASSLALAHPPSLIARQEDYLAVANSYRTQVGLPGFYKKDVLQANAQKAADDSPSTPQHELNPGSEAQVISSKPAGYAFADVYKAWVCERPKPELMCPNTVDGPNTSHADILNNPDYVSIGCGFSGELAYCDLATT